MANLKDLPAMLRGEKVVSNIRDLSPAPLDIANLWEISTIGELIELQVVVAEVSSDVLERRVHTGQYTVGEARKMLAASAAYYGQAAAVEAEGNPTTLTYVDYERELRRSIPVSPGNRYEGLAALARKNLDLFMPLRHQ